MIFAKTTVFFFGKAHLYFMYTYHVDFQVLLIEKKIVQDKMTFPSFMDYLNHGIFKYT